MLDILSKNKTGESVSQLYKEIDDIEYLKTQRQQLLKLKQSVDIGIKVLNEEQKKISKINIKSPKLASNYHKVKQKHHNSSHTSLWFKNETTPKRAAATFRPNLLKQYWNDKLHETKHYRSPLLNESNNKSKIQIDKESKSPVEMITWKTTKNFRPKFKKPPYKYEWANQETAESKMMSSKSFLHELNTKERKRSSMSRSDLTKADQNIFKLKSSIKSMSLNLLSSLVHLKYTKFYFCTIWALIDTICIVNSKDTVFFEDWQSVILFVKQNQLKLHSEVTNTHYWLQKMKFDQSKLAESRFNYFGRIQSENELLKDCQNSKEIRTILKFIFCIYRYTENTPMMGRESVNISSFIREHSDNRTTNEQKWSMISNDLNSSTNVCTPIHAPHSSTVTKASSACKTPTNRSESYRVNSLHRGSIVPEYKNKIYSVNSYNDQLKSESTEDLPTFTRTGRALDNSKSIITESNGANEDVDRLNDK